jgi:hypothetical protein
LQTTTEAAAKAADIKAKHLAKQLAEQRKYLSSKEKEATKLQKVFEWPPCALVKNNAGLHL